jgi:hypothetical protein
MSKVVKFENGFINEYEGEGLQLNVSVRASAVVSLTRVSPLDLAWRGPLNPVTYVKDTGGNNLVIHADPSDILAYIVAAG